MRAFAAANADWSATFLGHLRPRERAGDPAVRGSVPGQPVLREGVVAAVAVNKEVERTISGLPEKRGFDALQVRVEREMAGRV